jgi:hypothetical protein
VDNRPVTASGSKIERPGIRVPPVAAAAVVAILIARTAGAVRDQDTLWHVASGRDLLAGGSLVGADPFGVPSKAVWVRHQWLADLAFGAAEHFGGLRLVAGLLPIMTALTLLTVYLCLRRSAGRLVSLLLLVASFVGMSGSLSARPQVLSFLLTALVTWMWLHALERKRAPWLVIPVTWIWAMLHGLWVLSPVIGSVILVASLLSPELRESALRRSGVVLGSAIAGLLTPLGWHTVTAVRQVNAVRPYIQEWSRSALGEPAFTVSALLVLLLAALLMRSGRSTDGYVSWGLLILAITLTMSARRTVGAGAIIAAMTAAPYLQTQLGRAREAVAARERALVGGGALLGLVFAGLAIARGPELVGLPELPAAVWGLVPGERVCNEYDAGSWLLYAAPDSSPTIDGRLELYSPEQILAQRGFVTDGKAWPHYVQENSCTTVLMREGRPALESMSESGWRVRHATGGWILLETSR